MMPKIFVGIHDYFGPTILSNLQMSIEQLLLQVELSRNTLKRAMKLPGTNYKRFIKPILI